MEFKHFKSGEIIGLDLELVTMLDNARELAGVPFVITSGYRSKEDNERVGGAPNSAHRTGEAVDLKCTNSQDRLKIVRALLIAGFTRIGIANDHIHTDISKNNPQGVMFLE